MRTLFLYFLMILSNSLFSKEKQKQNKAQILSSENSIMWQISGNNLKQNSYLFGTIHAIPYDDYFLGKNTIKKIKECQNLVMELDLSNMNEQSIASLSLLPENTKITDFITAQEYNQLEDFLIHNYGMNKAIFENVYSKLKPLFVEQFIMLSIVGENKKMYENEINDIAIENNKQKIGLETLEEQLALFDSIPLALQYKNLIENLHQFEVQKKQYQDMVEAYKQQDIQYLRTQFDKHFIDEMSIYKTILLDDRNIRWIPKIEKIIQENSSFIAIGAGHLPGENGIINLLKKQGYTVQAIKIN
jgi:uncharacterized protein YbaP (TraB family)